MERDFLAVHDDGMPRVVSALKADHIVDLLSQKIDELALSLVAPLDADDHHIGHGLLLDTCIHCASRFRSVRIAGGKPATVHEDPAWSLQRFSGIVNVNRAEKTVFLRPQPFPPGSSDASFSGLRCGRNWIIAALRLGFAGAGLSVGGSRKKSGSAMGCDAAPGCTCADQL